MSQKTFCDICGKVTGEILYGVESDDKKSVRAGAKEYKDVCKKCYIAVYEFIEELRVKK